MTFEELKTELKLINDDKIPSITQYGNYFILKQDLYLCQSFIGEEKIYTLSDKNEVYSGFYSGLVNESDHAIGYFISNEKYDIPGKLITQLN